MLIDSADLEVTAINLAIPLSSHIGILSLCDNSSIFYILQSVVPRASIATLVVILPSSAVDQLLLAEIGHKSLATDHVHGLDDGQSCECVAGGAVALIFDGGDD
jgi:hypothetical protein